MTYALFGCRACDYHQVRRVQCVVGLRHLAEPTLIFSLHHPASSLFVWHFLQSHMGAGRLSFRDANIRLLLDAYRHRRRRLLEHVPPSSSPPPPPLAASAVGMKPTLLVSACLLGQHVTYRGGNSAPRGRCCKPVGFLLDCLWREHGLIDCLPICPEMDLLGMPSPRSPLRLVRNLGGGPHKVMMMSRSRGLQAPPAREHGEKDDELRQRLMKRHPQVAEELLSRQLTGVDGCVFKSRSPSCGVRDARLYASESGGSYDEVDGFFVSGWVRPADTGAVSLPLTTERQLYFDNDGPPLREEGRGCSYGLLSFVQDVVARFEARECRNFHVTA